ncbi:hypothetical protein Pan1_69 [Pseudanabaena phage Pan1]|nr:hypothetical protein Pan1_69 [Pseudanabaena phage Pan1]
MSDDSFDFKAFLDKASNPDNETARGLLQEAVGERMDTVIGEVSPRLWCILIREMQKDPHNNIHLNAVLNSALFAVLSWVAACTPRGQTNGRDNDEVLVEKITANLKSALENGRRPENAQQMAQLGANVGALKLAQDVSQELGKVIMSNSMIIQGIHKTILDLRKE